MKKQIVSILLLNLLLISCGTQKKSILKNIQDSSEKLNCRLPRVVDADVALGFPKVSELAPSIGKVNMTVLFVDFDDVPATRTPDSVFSVINPIASNFFNEVSYGKMELNLQPHFKWLRVSKKSEYYGMAIYRGQSHLDFIQEAVDLADAEVDFSQTHIVLVMTNPDAKEIRQGPTFKARDSEYRIRADGAAISTGITSGYDLNHWGGIWLPHETGHSLSLPDLYHFGTDSLNRYVGTFGLMGRCDAKAPGYFAFERWMLGWLDDSQIYCHESGEIILEIEAIETIGGIKGLIVPLDTTSALVIESRRKIGFDKNILKEGAIVYIVNTKIPGGRGPIQVKPGANNGNELLEDAPMAKGDKYIYQNVKVEILATNESSDKIKVTVQTK
ncbi:MAG: hypothetical protein AAF798_02145 [Bacteroidota bacterium]